VLQAGRDTGAAIPETASELQKIVAPLTHVDADLRQRIDRFQEDGTDFDR
jgi:hypothetical protein